MLLSMHPTSPPSPLPPRPSMPGFTVAVLGYNNNNTICTGSLIRQDLVITSSFCVDDFLADGMFVVASEAREAAQQAPLHDCACTRACTRPPKRAGTPPAAASVQRAANLA